MSTENMATPINIPSIDFQNKKDAGIQALLKTSFEYLLAGVAEQNSKYHRYGSIDSFNDKNEIMKPAVIAYPFFIALSNGHSNALYKLFGDFHTFAYGPVSLSLIDLFKNNHNAGNKIELDYFSINSFEVTVKKNKDENDFSSLKKRILKTNIEHFNTEFQNFKVQNDKASEFVSYLHEAIDCGIQAIANNTDYLFDGSIKSVTELSFYYESWAEKYQRNSTEVIKYEQIGNSRRSRPIYA